MKLSKKLEQVENYLAIARRNLKEVEIETHEARKELRKAKREAHMKLTNKQAAALLDVTPRTIVRWKNQGKLPDMSFTAIANYKKNR